MAKKISELTAISSIDSSDVLPIVDVSANTTNKVTSNNLVQGVVGDFTNLNTTDKTSLVNAINEVNTNAQDSIIIEVVTTSVSVAANSVTQITANTGKTGYTSLGIISVGTGDHAIGVTSWRAYSDSSILVFRNFSSTAKNNIAVEIKMLYKKNIS